MPDSVSPTNLVSRDTGLHQGCWWFTAIVVTGIWFGVILVCFVLLYSCATWKQWAGRGIPMHALSRSAIITLHSTTDEEAVFHAAFIYKYLSPFPLDLKIEPTAQP